jgi:hypothetical protein
MEEGCNRKMRRKSAIKPTEVLDCDEEDRQKLR